MSGRLCARCRSVNPDGFRFCGNCGARLDEVEAAGSGPLSRESHRVERRQLTVLFCDLVGSTELSQRLDPEDLRTVIRTYQGVCVPTTERYGGYMSRFLGDGILALFGYPRADEDDAERAVRASLDIVSAMRRIEWRGIVGEPLSITVRLGVATGIVVAGDLIGEGASAEEAVVGETPNLAARLQSLAEPGTVLVSERTRRLIGERFRTEALGSHPLKGFARPVPVWRVDGPTEGPSRFEARRAARVARFVNRASELDLLGRLWHRATEGRPQRIILSGEAGIGKSRLIETLRGRFAAEPHFFLRYQCSPYHTDTALHPFIARLEHAAGFAAGDSVERRRHKLVSMLRLAGTEDERTLRPIEDLLGLPGGGEGEWFDELDASGRRLATINALFDQLARLAESRPVFAVVEDVHWSDPSSLELLGRFEGAGRGLRVLVALTHRPDFDLAWNRSPDTSALRLERLDARFSADLVHDLAADGALPAPLIERIVAKAEGVPLFTEELTRALLTPGDDGGNRSEALGDAASEIPDTLHDLLMARLDRLDRGKRVAQIAAAIGRQFDHELLRRVLDQPGDTLEAGLDQLIDAGLVLEHDEPPQRRYSFKHALVRDTAYASLLRHDRRRYHRRIAEALESFDRAPLPQLLARHYTEAGAHGRAAELWLEAGHAAAERSAHREAIELFRNGLAVLHRIPDEGSADEGGRDGRRLRYLIGLGISCIAIHGARAEETEAVYREAVSLTETLPESPDHFAALWGWWRIAPDFETSARRAARLQTLAERLDDDSLTLQAHHCQWAVRFHLGDHGGCRRHVAKGLELYAGGDFRTHAARYGGHDPRACALGEAAQSLWLCGRIGEALEHMRQARLWAEETAQLGSLVHVMDMNLLLLRYRREPALAAAQADELKAIATENEYAEYVVKADVFKGWSLAKAGRIDTGARMLRQGIEGYDAIGTDEDPPIWLEMLADVLIDAGDHCGGLSAIEEALQRTVGSGLRFWQPELQRRRAELLALGGEATPRSIVESFDLAHEQASEQGAMSLLLRNTVTRVRHRERTGDDRFGRRELQALLTRFAPADRRLDTPDLREARALAGEEGRSA